MSKMKYNPIFHTKPEKTVFLAWHPETNLFLKGPWRGKNLNGDFLREMLEMFAEGGGEIWRSGHYYS
jgi:hypothetical protein